MENYTFSELTEFYFLGQAAMDTQFYFWVTVTFAAVVAGFVGGDELTLGLRILISVLYLLAAAVLVRFVTAASTIDEVRSFLEEAGALITEPRNSFLILLRGTLLIFGSAAAFFFLIRPNVTGSKRGDAN